MKFGIILLVLCISTAVLGKKHKKKQGKYNQMLDRMKEGLQKIGYVLFDSSDSAAFEMAYNLLETDMCGLKDPNKKTSMLLGTACKEDFESLFTSKGTDDESLAMCTDGACIALKNFKEGAPDFIQKFGKTKNIDQAQAFKLIESEIVNPLMEWMCACMGPVMETFSGCVSGIGDAPIWDVIPMSGQVNLSASYLDGKAWKTYWVDVISNDIEWDTIESFFKRLVQHLCQDNAQSKGKCYSYFYDTMTSVLKWYMDSVDADSTKITSFDDIQDQKDRKGRKNKKNNKEKKKKREKLENECKTFNVSLLDDNDIGYDDIKENLIKKLCVKNCKKFYQKNLFGCCTASFVQDKDLQQDLKDIISNVEDLITKVYDGSSDEDDMIENFLFNSIIMKRYEDVLEDLRNPTCPNNVKFDMTPCDKIEKEKKRNDDEGDYMNFDDEDF